MWRVVIGMVLGIVAGFVLGTLALYAAAEEAQKDREMLRQEETF